MVGSANVLPIACSAQETITRTDYTNTIRQPILNWLNSNPTKRPQYWVLFLDVPSRINAVTNPADYFSAPSDNSVSYELYSTLGNRPFVTHINMNGTNDCRGYIDQLASIATNYAAGKLIISASAGGYVNSNYYFDDTRFSAYGAPLPGTGSIAKAGVLAIDPAASVTYSNILDNGNLAGHITTGINVAGYLSWGSHSSLGNQYPTNGYVCFSASSKWYLVQTIESYNGQRNSQVTGQANFLMWFSPTAFCGTNYSSAPIGAVSHTDEPVTVDGQSWNDPAIYFGLWQAGKNFASSAWASRRTVHFQAIGDPLVKR